MKLHDIRRSVMAVKMKSTILSFIFITFALSIDASPTLSINEAVINDRPIIGILTQEVSEEVAKKYHYKYDTYLSASYVKFLESAGARVVPIWIGREDNYYEDILSQINGVLFPGGDADFNTTHGYADAGEIIYKIASKYNENGNYFPIWGTCLGFELLTYLAANRFEHRISCSSDAQALPLEFTADFENSRLFKNAPKGIVNILKTENVTANYHGFCVTKEGLIKANLTNELRVMSVNYDVNHLKFISSVEHVRLPFYAVQFHPEKNNFEWHKGKHIPHTYDAVRISQYFADFFVNEARKNHQTFLRSEDENTSLIYNFNPLFAADSPYVTQVYMFKLNKTTTLRTDYIVTQIAGDSLTHS